MHLCWKGENKLHLFSSAGLRGRIHGVSNKQFSLQLPLLEAASGSGLHSVQPAKLIQWTLPLLTADMVLAQVAQVSGGTVAEVLCMLHLLQTCILVAKVTVRRGRVLLPLSFLLILFSARLPLSLDVSVLNNIPRILTFTPTPFPSPSMLLLSQPFQFPWAFPDEPLVLFIKVPQLHFLLLHATKMLFDLLMAVFKLIFSNYSECKTTWRNKGCW